MRRKWALQTGRVTNWFNIRENQKGIKCMRIIEDRLCLKMLQTEAGFGSGDQCVWCRQAGSGQAVWRESVTARRYLTFTFAGEETPTSGGVHISTISTQVVAGVDISTISTAYLLAANLGWSR